MITIFAYAGVIWFALLVYGGFFWGLPILISVISVKNEKWWWFTLFMHCAVMSIVWFAWGLKIICS